MTTPPLMKPFERLVGTWTTEATHPAMPGVIVRGTVVVEWLEGQHFVLHRARTDHADFPDSLWVIGSDETDRIEGHDDAAVRTPCIHYFDSRGVFRRYETSADDTAWRWSRDASGFSQRFTGTFADDGGTIVGLSQLRRDDEHWTDDLAITYRRSQGPA